MAIQLQARNYGEKAWGVRSAYITENKKVSAFENSKSGFVSRDHMSRDQLISVANSDMIKWIASGSEHNVEFRVIDTETLPVEERREFERGRT